MQPLELPPVSHATKSKFNLQDLQKSQGATLSLRIVDVSAASRSWRWRHGAWPLHRVAAARRPPPETLAVLVCG